MRERNTKIDYRDEFFMLNRVQLERIAFHAVQKGIGNNDFVVVAIDVDDRSWKPMVDYLMPGKDWDQYRNKGEKPVVRGYVDSDITSYIGQVVPDIASEFCKEVPCGLCRCVVMGDGGASVYNILPDPHGELN